MPDTAEFIPEGCYIGPTRVAFRVGRTKRERCPAASGYARYRGVYARRVLYRAYAGCVLGRPDRAAAVSGGLRNARYRCALSGLRRVAFRVGRTKRERCPAASGYARYRCALSGLHRVAFWVGRTERERCPATSGMPDAANAISGLQSGHDLGRPDIAPSVHKLRGVRQPLLSILFLVSSCLGGESFVLEFFAPVDNPVVAAIAAEADGGGGLLFSRIIVPVIL
ncbi:hypothetical protein EDC23_0215 [Thiohalophilus thiocyanatoxydans]|uniref:Uncharacterized protein n=1 Tax=Thiohalophilus thiocyanatoxydans TaxID=381308 RepID=A0A4R8ITU7_9GAMM|nr:hypothetical protein EDC23_0215 [Thiohalophilus thiocyanatoxydans]